MGVFLVSVNGPNAEKSLPHACGGVSTLELRIGKLNGSSPRLWGCFYPFVGFDELCNVFPTPVGVFPDALIEPVTGKGLPHACGGVSIG